MTKMNDDYEIYCSYTDSALKDTVSCPFPSCHVKGRFHNDGTYERLLVCYTDSQVVRHQISVPMIECDSCSHSHALLAPVIIPYSPFSFHFVISLLYDYVTHNFETITTLCHKYDISVSTLYRIYLRFISDRKLMLGMMETAIGQAQELLCTLTDPDFVGLVDPMLQKFFRSNHASFLQARCKIRLKPKSRSGTSTSSP